VPDLDAVDRHYALMTREAARGLVRPVAVTLTALYGVFASAHLLLWGGAAGTGMAFLALGSALFFLVATLGYRTPPVRKHPHLALGTFSFVALGNALSHLALTGNPTQTTNLALIFLGVGALIFHTPTLVAVLATGLLGWIGIGAWWSFSDPAWIHFGFGILSATLLAALIYQGRNRLIRIAARLQSENREREGELRAGRKRYEELFSASPGMICIHDLAGYILDANMAGASAIGIPRHRLVGMNVGPFLLNNDRQVPTEYLETLARDGSAEGLVTVEGADGKLKRWKYRSTVFRDGEEGDYVVAAALDVTELEEAREALVRAKDELERVMDETGTASPKGSHPPPGK